jgi:hypothetical protein
MSSITQQIEEILDKRLGRGIYSGRGRLQKIEARIASLEAVKENVEQLDALVSTIQKQIEEKHGDYFNMLVSDPDALSQFGEVSCKSSKDKLTNLIDALTLLKKRFEREAIRIAFIGRERQGKSTFIKTITGLNDKVIPAYSGNSCTGAVSVIHNVQAVQDESGRDVKVKVVAEYYDMPTFLEMVNKKLLRFFPDGSMKIGRLDQIEKLHLPENLSGTQSTKVIAEYLKFKTSVVENFGKYSHLIGVGIRNYYDEDEIAQHVAQYEEFDHEVPGSHKVQKDDGTIIYQLDYFKYVAVKTVNIYTRFEIETTKKLELVDTIGIGSSADSEAIEKEMYRVLREDCDGAIDMYRPDVTPNYPQEQADLLDNIIHNLSDREPEKWVVYVLNKITSGFYKNAASAESVLKTAEDIIGRKTPKPVAWAKAIDGTIFDDVRDELVSPLLSLIAENLDRLDQNLIDKTDSLCKEAYNECLTLVKAANAVTSAGAGLSSDAMSLFDEKLYKELLKSFGYAMNMIDQKGYATKRDTECVQLEQAYCNIINQIDTYIPDEDVILERFETGALVTQNQMFEEYVEQMRNDIFTAFEDVNTKVLYPLQEKVKTDLIEILFNQGLLRNLPTSHETASIEWLKEVLDNYVDESKYPNFRKALQFILDYQINIEGLVEYNVTKSLYILDKTHSEFIPYKGEFTEDFEQKASDVWQELCNRLKPVQNRLREWISSFTLIPSHSFYSRVHKFHVKVMTDTEGKEDFRRFYRQNMGLIWAGEINAVGKAQKAFGDWTERVRELQQVVTSDNFKLN